MEVLRFFTMPRWIRLALALSILFIEPVSGAWIAHASPAEPVFSGCGGVSIDPLDAGFEAQVVVLVNTHRAEAGLPPLKRATGLDRAARYHAADMAQDNYFKHDTYDRQGGELVMACDTWERIIPFYAPPDWMSLAENIGFGYTSPEEVVQGWMNSPAHRANLLSTDNWEIGVGYWKGGGERDYYWVQDFGRRTDTYPLVINAEAESTDGRAVSLYVFGTTAEWQELRLRNDNDDWEAWRPFANEINWELNPQAGMHTVSLELRGPRGNAASQDTILLTREDIPSRNRPSPHQLFLPLSRR